MRPGPTAYEQLTHGSAAGTWVNLLPRAKPDADAARDLDWLVADDSTTVRVPERGATARRVGGNAETVPAHWRGLATRHDQHARNYAGAIKLAALLNWLPCPSHTRQNAGLERGPRPAHVSVPSP
jgi:transposase